MAVDPSIALGVKPLEVANPFTQYAQVAQLQGVQQANQLNQMKMEEYGRARQEEDSIRNYLANKELGAPETRNGLMQFGKTGLEYSKLMSEQDKARADIQEKQMKIAADKTAMFKDALADVNTPQQAAAWIAAQHQDSDLKPIVSSMRPLDQALAAIPTDPKGFADWKAKNALGMSKFIERSTMTASEKANLGVAQGHLQLARETAAKPVWNEAGQGWVTPPNANNPTGGFTPVPEIQATKDQRSAVKALKTAGYNVETGEDEISKLIKKSTGGLAEQGLSAAAGMFNYTTSGREAIGRLQARANQISLDMLNGKLGAGISNDDRNFIVSTLGSVADPSIPSDQRMAAWDEAKKRMVTSGLLPEPKKAPAAAGAGEVDHSNPLLKP